MAFSGQSGHIVSLQAEPASFFHIYFKICKIIFYSNKTRYLSYGHVQHSHRSLGTVPDKKCSRDDLVKMYQEKIFHMSGKVGEHAGYWSSTKTAISSCSHIR